MSRPTLFILAAALALQVLLVLPSQARAAAFDRDAYTMTSWSTTIKSMWHFNVLSATRDEDIDNTLRILECPIYAKYSRDDFEWQKIREAMRKEIELKKGRWPVQVKFVQPVELDDYDFDRKVFPLRPESRWEGVYRIQIAQQAPTRENACTSDLTYGIDNMPHNASLRLPRAFKLMDVEVSDEIAEVYIDRINKMEERDGREHREAYAVFYVTLERYIDTVTDTRGIKMNLAEFAGKIDRIEFYADPQLTLPLHYKTDVTTTPVSVLPSDTSAESDTPKPALIDTTKAINQPEAPQQPAPPQQ